MDCMARPTIADIARTAGVSSTAVSFALNGRPGVAEPTREKIMAIARDMGWTPNSAARALSTSRVNAIGLIITSSYAELARDTFFLQLIAGVEHALSSSPVALVLKIVENFEDELTAIRQWHGESRIDGLILVNPRPDDPRPALTNTLGVPTVFIGKPGTSEPFSSVFIDDALVMDTLIEDLVAHGTRRIAYLHSHARYSHGEARLKALRRSRPGITAIEHGIPLGELDDTCAAIRDFASMLDLTAATTFVCESEDLTLATLRALGDLDVAVPADASIVSWESTPGLTLRTPAVSTLERSPAEMGSAAVELLRDMRDNPGPEPRTRELACPRLHARDTLPPRVEG